MTEPRKALSRVELLEKYKLPVQELRFELPVTKGDKTGLEFSGLFIAKILTLDEEAEYSAERDLWVYKVSNGSPEKVSEGLHAYIEARTFLKKSIIEAPEWWYDFQDNPMDMNVVMEVYILASDLKKKLDERILSDNKAAISVGSKKPKS